MNYRKDTSDSYASNLLPLYMPGYSLSSHSNLSERFEENRSWGNYSQFNASVIVTYRTQATGSRVANIVRAASSRFSSLGDQIAFIQSELSLRTSELSKVLRVSRPTIYTWMKSEGVPRDENLTRISTLTRLAEYWASLSTVPIGDGVRQHVSEQGRLIDLLNQEDIQSDLIESILKEIAQASDKQLKTDAKPNPEELALKYGIKNFKNKHENAEITLLSGKRVSSE